jgi:hypothetical protein
MHRHAMDSGHLGHDLVQRQVPLGRQPIPHPVRVPGQLALGMVALGFRHKATCLALQDHHVVHKAWRHTKMPRRLTMPMPLLDKGDDPAPQLDRMWLTHHEPPYLAGSGNHKPNNLGILNRMDNDML